MDVHRPLQDRERRLGIHNIENAVNDLVPRKPQQRRPEDLFRFLIDQDLHETLFLAFSYPSATFPIRLVAIRPGRSRFPTFGSGMAAASRRGTGESAVAVNSM